MNEREFEIIEENIKAIQPLIEYYNNESVDTFCEREYPEECAGLIINSFYAIKDWLDYYFEKNGKNITENEIKEANIEPPIDTVKVVHMKNKYAYYGYLKRGHYFTYSVLIAGIIYKG
jgi:hypothetical protein